MSTVKTALVTGGSRGIGRAIVARFKAAGWRVATCATDTLHLIRSPADFAFACNVAEAREVRDAVAAVVRQLGHIDVLVNCAGLAGSNPLEPDTDDHLWHRILDVNLHGTYYFTKHAFPHMPRGGRIVNLGSVLSHWGVADQTAYTAAKHAVLGFTRAFAEHAAPNGVTVNCVCPNWVRTDMARARWRELGIDEDEAAAQSPLGRVSEPAEVAELVFYLCSDAAANITGQAFNLDAGSPA